MDEELKRLIVDTGAETRRHFDVVAEGLRQELGATTAELRQENAETRQHIDVVAEGLRQDLGAATTEMRQHLNVVTAETRRHFDVVAEGMRQDVKGVAEGCLTVSERVDRLTDEMNDRFSETNGELKLVTEAVGRLDTRVVKLEAKVDRVETTVERVISILQADHTGVIARLDKLEARR